MLGNLKAAATSWAGGCAGGLTSAGTNDGWHDCPIKRAKERPRPALTTHLQDSQDPNSGAKSPGCIDPCQELPAGLQQKPHVCPSLSLLSVLCGRHQHAILSPLPSALKSRPRGAWRTGFRALILRVSVAPASVCLFTNPHGGLVPCLGRILPRHGCFKPCSWQSEAIATI